MQDVEQGEPQSQVLFRVTFLQCITLARQTLHHKSATYQQRHHEAARLPDPPARGPAPGSALPPPGSLRRIRTGEPAATGAGRRGRDRPGGDERHAGRRRSGERNHPVEPLPSRRPAAAAVSGTTWDRSRPPGLFRQDGRGRPSRRWRTACSEPVPAGRPGAAGSGSTGAAWGVCAMSPTRTPAVATNPVSWADAPGRPGSAGDRAGSSAAHLASATPLSVCCAPSPSAAPLLLVQWRVKRRSRVKGTQQTRTRTGPRVSPCMEPPSHSPLSPHWPRPSHRGRGRTCGRRGPATRKGGRRASSRTPPRGPHHHTPARTPMRKAQ